MAPTSEAKSKQFAFTLSEEELGMLQELAEQDDRSAAGWIRHTIRVAHAAMTKKRQNTSR